MTEPSVAEWKLEPISAGHDCSFFGSGRPDIDTWLHEHALRLQRERSVVTYVWADQSPFVSAFFALAPHKLEDDEARMSGHAGGVLSGYLIAKIGVDQRAIDSQTRLSDEDRTVTVPVLWALVVHAVVRASAAARLAGGKWLFIDTTNEPQCIMDALARIGFKSITPEDNSVHFVKLGSPSEA